MRKKFSGREKLYQPECRDEFKEGRRKMKERGNKRKSWKERKRGEIRVWRGGGEKTERTFRKRGGKR